jgi:hypothetical protein
VDDAVDLGAVVVVRDHGEAAVRHADGSTVAYTAWPGSSSTVASHAQAEMSRS